MSKIFSKNIFFRILGSMLLCIQFSNVVLCQPNKIDRNSLVKRHTIKLNAADTLASLSVGNGSFAFTVDITGLQSFPDEYANGVPLGTQSVWGWHAFPNVNHYKEEDALRTYHLNGRDVTYMVQNNGGPELAKKTADYFRVNEHRLHLANIGLELIKKNGLPATLSDIKSIDQQLDMWTGKIQSSFTVEGVPVHVITYGHQQQDAVAFKITSPLITQKRLKVRIRLPYPSGEWGDRGNHWENDNMHLSTIVNKSTNTATINHTLDTSSYFVSALWKGKASFTQKQPHYYLISPGNSKDFEVSIQFDEKNPTKSLPSFPATAYNSKQQWAAFWNSGGAIDISGSTDPRAFELERRIVLSQYLTKIQCAGDYPPQETGLTYNSWYGKPHLEMHWWHGIHFALWGRPELLQKSVDWYFRVQNVAKGISKRQGYEGIRWQKMTDNKGREVPSSIGSFLIWQQPHFIYFTELLYRAKLDKAILHKYKDLVFGTADFMASFAYFDSTKQKYILGKGLI